MHCERGMIIVNHLSTFCGFNCQPSLGVVRVKGNLVVGDFSYWRGFLFVAFVLSAMTRLEPQ